MTEKHFEAFAREIRKTLDSKLPWGAAVLAAEHMAIMVTNVAMEFNERFDVVRFRKACGLSD